MLGPKDTYMEPSVVEFLRESNAIECEYSDIAFEDAVLAWQEVLEYEEISELHHICVPHNILLGRVRPVVAGIIRKVNVEVGGRICPNPGSLRRMLYQWMPLLKEARTEDDIKNLHVAFEAIHPFEDGNGRIGRILMNWQRQKVGLPILVIKESEKEEYYNWFR